MSDKNSAAKLRDHLFDQMTRLSDPKANLEVELQRATALAKVGTVIVNSAKQEIEMMKLVNVSKGKGNPGKEIEMSSIKKKAKQLSNG